MGPFVLFLVLLGLVIASNVAKKAIGDDTRRRVTERAAARLRRARLEAEAYAAGLQAAKQTETVSAREEPVSPGQTSRYLSLPGSSPDATAAQTWWARRPVGMVPSSGPPMQAGPGTDEQDRTAATPWDAPEPVGADPTEEAAEEPATLLSTRGPPAAMTGPSEGRDIGSAALESTLDSTIESSLLGVPDSPTITSTPLAGERMQLTEEVEAQILAFLSDGHEVAAVRLICDTADCGILDAMRTIEGYR